MKTTVLFKKQTLRLVLAVLAFILPIILPLGKLLLNMDHGLLPSISSYYYSTVKTMFLIDLILFGLTFIIYGLKASSHQPILIATGILSLLIAIFPTHAPGAAHTWIGYFHIVCAVAFFAMLGLVIRDTFNLPLRFLLLTKIGTAIWIVEAVLIVYFLAFKNLWPPLVFFLESVILWLFTGGIFIRNKINKKLGGQ